MAVKTHTHTIKKIMRCKNCGAETIRIHTMGGPAVCWASPTTYWPTRDNEARELLTPNGNNVYGSLTGEPQDAIGIGHLPHTCHQMLLVLQGRDSWERPVYKGPDGNLYVDVDPRDGWEPNICTKYRNEFDGEPDDPVTGVDFIFTPFRDVW